MDENAKKPERAAKSESRQRKAEKKQPKKDRAQELLDEDRFQKGVPDGHVKLFLRRPIDGGKRIKPFDKYNGKIFYRDTVHLYPHMGTIVPKRIADLLLETDPDLVSKMPYFGIEEDTKEAMSGKNEKPKGSIKDYFEVRPQTKAVIFATLSKLAESATRSMSLKEIDESFAGLGLHVKPGVEIPIKEKLYWLDVACELAGEKINPNDD